MSGVMAYWCYGLLDDRMVRGPRDTQSLYGPVLSFNDFLSFPKLNDSFNECFLEQEFCLKFRKIRPKKIASACGFESLESQP